MKINWRFATNQDLHDLRVSRGDLGERGFVQTCQDAILSYGRTIERPRQHLYPLHLELQCDVASGNTRENVQLDPNENRRSWNHHEDK